MKATQLRTASALCLVLLATWCLLCVFSFESAPPLNVRFIRCCAVGFVLAFGLAEFWKRWVGVGAFLVVWPHMFVFRELGAVHIRGWINEFPISWHGPVAAALVLGIWLRRELWEKGKGEENGCKGAPQRTAATGRSSTVLQTCLWVLATAWLVGAVAGWWRATNPPGGWVVDNSGWEQFFKANPFASYAPVASVISYVPVLLLGIVLLGYPVSVVHSAGNRPDADGERNPTSDIEHPKAGVPVRALLWCMAIGGFLAVLNVLWQVGMASGWSFDVMQEGYGKRLWEQYRWSFDLGPPSGPFCHRNTVAPFMFLTAAGIGALGSHLNSSKKWWLLIPGILSLWAVVFTQSRNGLLLVLAVPSLVLLVRCSRWRFIAAIALPVVIACIFLFAPLPHSSKTTSAFLARTLATMELLKEGDWHEGLSGRPRLFGTAWKIFAEYPLTGSGPGTFPMLASPYSKFGKRLETDLISATNWPQGRAPEGEGERPVNSEQKTVNSGEGRGRSEQRAEDFGPRPEDRGQKTENRRQRTEDKRQPALRPVRRSPQGEGGKTEDGAPVNGDPGDASAQGSDHSVQHPESAPPVFPAGFRPAGTFYSAHSTPIHLLAETGLLGFLSWMVLWIGWPLWAVTRWRRGNMIALCVLAIGLASLLDTPWMVPGMSTVGVVLMALAVNVERACEGSDARRGVDKVLG